MPIHHLLFTLLLALGFSVVSFGADAQTNARSQAARESHANIWAAFEMKKNCVALLGSDGPTNVSLASERLLEMLTGHQMPDPKAIDDGQPAFYGWSPEGLKQMPAQVRAELAARIYRMQHSFSLDKSQFYSFGHAVRGRAEVEAYREAYVRSYEAAYEKLEVRPEMDRKNRRLNIRAVKSSLLKIGMIAAAYGTSSMIFDNELLALGTGLLSAFVINELPFPANGRLSSYFSGHESYREVVGPYLNVSTMRFPYLSRGKIPPQLEDANLYLEVPISISTGALNALRKEKENAFSELFRSCLILSPEKPCDEHSALLELMHLSENGLIGAVFKISDERLEANQKTSLHKGRLAMAYYADPETQEPVLLHWLQFDLDPFQDGKKQSKKQTEEKTAEDWNWEGGLQPSTLALPLDMGK